MFSKMITEGREGVKKGSKSDNIIVANSPLSAATCMFPLIDNENSYLMKSS